MTVNYTTLLGLAQPVTGTEANAWGDVVNDQITALVEEAVAGGETIDVTAGNVTLSTTVGAANQARNAILLITGTPGTSRNVVAPTQSKVYLVKNSADAAVVLKGAATTGVTIPVGVEALCFFNGSDFEIVGVNGPASSTDNAVARFDSTTGKVIQNSGVTIDDSNNISGVAQLNATTVDATNVEVTNIKAKDGTAAGSIADSTGVVTLASSVLTTTDINGGTIDATTVGATTPATGSFTTLAASSPASFAAGTAAAPSITRTGDTNTGMFFPAADTIAFSEGGSERLRITSAGNVGIGTSSPRGLLDLGFSAAGGLSNVTSQYQIVLEAPSGTGNFGRNIAFAESTGVNAVAAAINGVDEGAATATGLSFATGNSSTIAERMRITSAGNVGIGTSSPDAKFHVAQSASGKITRIRDNYYQLRDNKTIAAGVAVATTVNFLEIDFLAGTHAAAIINLVVTVQAAGTDAYRRVDQVFATKAGSSVSVTSKNAAGSNTGNTVTFSVSGNKVIFTYTKRAILDQAQQNFSYIEIMGISMAAPGGGAGVESPFTVTFL